MRQNADNIAQMYCTDIVAAFLVGSESVVDPSLSIKLVIKKS